MEIYKFIDGDGYLIIEWIGEKRRFAICFDEKECGWFYTDKEYNNYCGSIEKNVLIDIKNAIEKVLLE